MLLFIWCIHCNFIIMHGASWVLLTGRHPLHLVTIWFESSVFAPHWNVWTISHSKLISQRDLFHYYHTDSATFLLCYHQSKHARVTLTPFFLFRSGMAAESSVFIGLCEYLSLSVWEGQRSCSTFWEIGFVAFRVRREDSFCCCLCLLKLKL